MKKIGIYLFLLLIVSITVSVITFNLYQREKGERQRVERNLESSLSDIQYYISKSGELVTKIEGLELNEREFRKLESELYKEISSLKVKLKNAESVIQIETVIKYVNKDSIIYVSLNDSTRRFNIQDKWISARVDVTDFKFIPPGGFVIDSIPNKINLVSEKEYKGWWFWKKVVGVNVHIVNSNPYITVTDGKYIDLRK